MELKTSYIRGAPRPVRCAAAEDPDPAASMTAEELHQDWDGTILDLRDQAGFAANHIPGSLNPVTDEHFSLLVGFAIHPEQPFLPGPFNSAYEETHMTMTLNEVLSEALMDEYKARDTYRAVIDAFGPVRPFVHIVEAEQRHIDALLPLFAKYRIPVPTAPDPSRIVLPQSLLEACREGVAAEIDNLTMYDRLLAATREADVRLVLERLQAASRDRHLPAFERCVERGGTSGGGGGGGGRGHGGRGRGGCRGH
jgi:hypothetical protein